MDGNFAIAPTIFMQLCVIQGKVSGDFVPLAYVLLQRKTRTSYEAVLHVLEEHGCDPNVTIVTVADCTGWFDPGTSRLAGTYVTSSPKRSPRWQGQYIHCLLNITLLHCPLPNQCSSLNTGRSQHRAVAVQHWKSTPWGLSVSHFFHPSLWIGNCHSHHGGLFNFLALIYDHNTAHVQMVLPSCDHYSTHVQTFIYCPLVVPLWVPLWQWLTAPAGRFDPETSHLAGVYVTSSPKR